MADNGHKQTDSIGYGFISDSDANSMKINRHVSPIENEVQDRSSDAWKALCRYVDELEESGAEEFSPRDVLGPELYAGIFTLPESIAKLKRVTKVWRCMSR